MPHIDVMKAAKERTREEKVKDIKPSTGKNNIFLPIMWVDGLKLYLF